MAESTIKMKMEGVDNASSTIRKVAGELSDMGVAANNNAANIAKGGDAIKAAMGAANGSIGGAIGAVKGMTVAIQGMGVAMSTALPIAAAIGAAIFAVKAAYDAIQKSHQEEIDKIKDETKARLEQKSAIDGVASAMEKQIAHQERMAKMQFKLDGGDALDEKNLEAKFLRKRDKAAASEIGQREANIAALQDQETAVFLKKLGASGKEYDDLAAQQVELQKAIQAEKDKIVDLNRKRAEIAKQLEVNSAEQDKLVEAERLEAEARVKAQRALEQEAFAKAEAIREQQNIQLMRLNADIQGFDPAKRAQLEASILQREADKITAQKEAVLKEMEKTPLGWARAQLKLKYDELAGQEQIALKTLERHNAIEKRRVEEEQKRLQEKKEQEDKQAKLNDLLAKKKQAEAYLSDQLKKNTELRLSSLNFANTHQTNLLLDRLNGAGRDNTTMEISNNVKKATDYIASIEKKIAELKAI